MKFIIAIGVTCCCFATEPQVWGQVLLTEKTINISQAGTASIFNSPLLNLTFGMSPNPGHARVLMLFKDLWVTSENVGQIYIQGPDDNPGDFSQYTSYLTDGRVSYCDVFGTVAEKGGSPVGGFGQAGAPETWFFDYLPPGGNGVDLGGFAIDYYTLVINSFSFTSPGSNPNHDGNWTDYSISATFSVYGEPVPEPRSLELFAAFGTPGLFCLWITNYRRRSMSDA